MFCSCFVVIVALSIFIFVCTNVGLLPPGESPIAVSGGGGGDDDDDDDDHNSNNNKHFIFNNFLFPKIVPFMT
jgi:hypothetical protein